MCSPFALWLVTMQDDATASRKSNQLSIIEIFYSLDQLLARFSGFMASPCQYFPQSLQ